LTESAAEIAAGLNPDQAEAVAHSEGPLLVFAGAGSGKTRVITYRIANLLATHGVPPYRILAVTFTNKAAGELRKRLERLAGEEVTRDLWAGTFHSVCARILRRHHEEAELGRDFVIYDDADQKAVMSRLLKEKNIDERERPPRWVLGLIHAQKREGKGPRDVDRDAGFDNELLELFEGYERMLAQSNAVDFEDLIIKAMRLAEDEKGRAGVDLRHRFRHVLVDEFQDTNITQYRLVRALTLESRNLCVVGDDDQSIYRWRGANVRIIRGFRRDYPDAKIVKLTQNYRSTGNIVAAALGVILPARDREPKQLWTDQPEGDAVHVRAVDNERTEATFVVNTVKKELMLGVDAREMAVFYRVHAQSRVLEEAFRSEGVPYQIIGGMRFFERAEVKDLVAYLRLLQNPRSDADLLRIINVPARGIGDKTVELVLETSAERSMGAYSAISTLVAEERVTGAAKKKLAAFWQMMEGLRLEARELTASRLAGRVLEATGYRDRLREIDNAEADARLGNLEELIGSIREHEDEAALRGTEATLSTWLERVSLVSAVDSAKDTPSVSLMTVHAAKGLEFTTVFLTGLEEEIFPYRGLTSDQIDDLEEERRLAYVAITRARKRLFITHCGIRTLFGKSKYLTPSRFLSDLPKDAIVLEGKQRSLPTPGMEFPGRERFGGWSGRGREPDWGQVNRGIEKARRALQLGERVVDTEAFDDIPDEEDF
jgi:DNA helicase II / ATP-dependent DNA helicase PcrA